MKHGDLSKETVPAVAVRWEYVVWDPTGGKPNLVGKAHLEKLFNNECEVILFTTGDERKAKASAYKWNLSYSKLIGVDSVLEIPLLAQAHQIIAYWDVDSRVLDNVRSSGPNQIEIFKWEQNGHTARTAYSAY